MSPRPQLSPFFPQSPFSLHFSGGVGRALFDCQCWIRGIERGWQRAGGTCFGFVALLKWPLWCACSKGTSPPAAAFSHCDLRLMKYQGPSLRAAAPLLQAKHVPPTSVQSVFSRHCAPAGGTHHPRLSSVRFFGQPRCSCRRNMSPGLSSVRFLRVRPSSILQMEWGGLFFSPHQVPCLVCRLSGIHTRLQNVTEGGGMYFACRSESDSPQG